MLSEATREKLAATSGPPTNLEEFGKQWGVVEVEWKDLNVKGSDLPKAAYGRAAANLAVVDGMVLPKDSGYKIVLNSNRARSRFSWAHEIGHIIVQSDPSVLARFGHEKLSHKSLEKLCDKIAAEILMPEELFLQHMYQQGLSLANVPYLASVFDSSMLSTALRFTDLLPFPAVLSVWETVSNHLTYSWPHENHLCRPCRFGIPKGTRAKGTGWTGPHMAFKSSNVVPTEEPFLMTRRSRGGESHKWQSFPTESVGVGSYENRYVLSLSYVDVPSTGKVNNSEPLT